MAKRLGKARAVTYISIKLFNKIKSIYSLSYLKALKVIILKLLNINKDLLYKI
jgi:hypothetical protein